MKMRVMPPPTLLGCPPKTLNRTRSLFVPTTSSHGTHHIKIENCQVIYFTKRRVNFQEKRSSKSQFSELSEIFQADDDQIRVKLPKMDLHSR